MSTQYIQDHIDLITSQHNIRPNFMGVVETYLKPLDELYDCFQTYEENFHIDTAVGNQLDIIGYIVGIGRTLPFQPTNGNSSVLNDEDYRFLIKARILWNTWKGTREDLVSLWKRRFPNSILQLQDNLDMTVDVGVTFVGLSEIQLDMIEQGLIIPRPAGVKYNTTIVRLPAFGYDRSDELIDGYDNSTWVPDFIVVDDN